MSTVKGNMETTKTKAGHTQRTPGEWRVARTISGTDYGVEFTGINGAGEKTYSVFVEAPAYVVAGVSGIGKDECLANALAIVRAVNAHGALVAALREAHELIDGCRAMLKPRGNWSDTEDATIEQIETVLEKHAQ